MSQSITDRIKDQIEIVGSTVVRRNRKMSEALGLSIDFTADEVKSLSYRQIEYEQYREMILPQIPRFKKYYDLDRFSRRLLIQFPADWYEGGPEDYMPCPESFLVQYRSADEYGVVFNERSVELSRATEDVAIVYKICKEDLRLEGNLSMFYVHYMNIHIYLDGGSSEDFDVKNGYFSKKV
jgi:hypothetical protein